MKKILLPIFLILLLPFSYSCGTLKSLGYNLTEADAASAIRQMLDLGTRENLSGAFSKETILSTLLPESVSKTLNTINTLGLTSEVDRFTTTLSNAAQKSATAATPIFVNSINNLTFTDAIRIIKNGGTSATDYLRSSAGSNLRQSIRPVMQAALDEYKINEQWNNIIKPVKALAGNKLNLDLATLMAGAVSEAMFRKIAEKEVQVRSDASARTTSLLQNVFSKNWNQQ
ncbi:DUF4197 domain-containing protein [Segetibacter sp.]|uniref:DUF4197 domain-containing protein n=1 Tax=Segetibacter sp. TaxID=2231182 RepID=UPI002601619C|nr:DUF4197 domain-containing protein [Segetibacter sp.]MCW3079812.1 hypothetical protein [Segetibacter sp.]